MSTFPATTFVNSGLNFQISGGFTMGSLAFDKNGNLFCTSHTNSILKITPSGTVSTFVNSGLNFGATTSQGYLAFDKKGNLFCSDNEKIVKITPDGSVSTFVNEVVAAMLFDKNGIMFCTTSTGNSIIKITPSGSISTFVNSGLDTAAGLAFDRSGNLYCSDVGTGIDKIFKITPSGNMTEFASVDNLLGLMSDKNGNLYTGTMTTNKLFRISTSGVVEELITTGATIDDIESAVFDNRGNLYISNSGNDTIIKVALGVPSEFLVIATFLKKTGKGSFVNPTKQVTAFLESLPASEKNSTTLQSLILQYQNSREALLEIEKAFGVSIVG